MDILTKNPVSNICTIHFGRDGIQQGTTIKLLVDNFLGSPIDILRKNGDFFLWQIYDNVSNEVNKFGLEMKNPDFPVRNLGDSNLSSTKMKCIKTPVENGKLKVALQFIHKSLAICNSVILLCF